MIKKLQEIQASSTRDNPVKSVVVSQWTKMLDVAEHHLKALGAYSDIYVAVYACGSAKSVDI